MSETRNPIKNTRLIASLIVMSALSAKAGAAQTTTILHEFGPVRSSDGAYPTAGLLLDTQGNLFGVTGAGGNQSFSGTVFELSPDSHGGWTEKVIHDFYSSPGDGIYPNGNLISDARGNLYGTTINGGSTFNGTVYELSPASGGSWTEKVIYSFGAYSTDGIQPTGNLTFDTAGNLYGVTALGGTNSNYSDLGDGTVYELTPSSGGSWTMNVLYNFGATPTDGAVPSAGLTIDTSGKLYGTTCRLGAYSGGTAFELTQQNDSWQEKTLHDFADPLVPSDGACPFASLIFDPHGNFYGTTEFGGNENVGTAFELSPAPLGKAWTERILHSFGHNQFGYYPYSPLTLNSAGNLFGATSFSGNPNQGALVFELLPQPDGSWQEEVLQNFATYIFGGVIFDTKGALYGTTYQGGSQNTGTVYKIDLAAPPPTPISTTTTLVASPSDHLVAGEPITLTATVVQASGPAVPIGAVRFASPSGGGSVTVALDQTGRAVFRSVVPPPGTYSVFAAYGGASGFASSTSGNITRMVTAPPPK